MTTLTTTTPLASLRALTPHRDVLFSEALRVAELQAATLVRLLDPSGDGLRDHHVAAMPRIKVTYERLPVSGMSYWNGREWVIAIAGGDSLARQRFTLLHEFKHIIDHGYAPRLYTGNRHLSPANQAERSADYFAGCALVPKQALKRAWGNGIQRITDLAAHFGVSEQAITVRLDQTGLNVIDAEPRARCARPISSGRWQPQRFQIQRGQRRYA